MQAGQMVNKNQENCLLNNSGCDWLCGRSQNLAETKRRLLHSIFGMFEQMILQNMLDGKILILTPTSMKSSNNLPFFEMAP
jgi:hypothetical protein